MISIAQAEALHWSMQSRETKRRLARPNGNTLAALRRFGLITAHDEITVAGRAVLTAKNRSMSGRRR